MSDVLNPQHRFSLEQSRLMTYSKYKVCSLQYHTKIYFLLLSNQALSFCTISDLDIVLLRMTPYLVVKEAQYLLCVLEKMLSQWLLELLEVT